MERYVGGEEVDATLLVAGPRAGGRARRPSTRWCPVDATTRRRCARAARPGRGAASRRRSSTRCPRCSRPAGRTGPALRCDPDGPLVAEVVKTTSDPYVGRVSLVRVFSGTVAARRDRARLGPPLGVRRAARTGTRTTTRTSGSARCRCPLGKTQRPADRVVAGDICAIGRLVPRRDRGHPVRPGHPAGAEAVDDARAAAAGRRSRRGPRPTRTSSARGWRGWPPRTPRCASSTTPRPTRSCSGRWARRTPTWSSTGSRTGTASRSTRSQLRVPLRETFAGRPRATAGTSSSPAGTGSSPSATSRSSRCPAGRGFEFVDKVVGGAVPRQFIPSVEKGVRAQMERGVAAGYPVVDIRVTLHRRQVAQRRLLRHGLPDRRRRWRCGRRPRRRGRCLLEPVDEVAVLVPDELVGTVMSDLSGRRGRVLGSEPCRRRPDPGARRGAAGGDRPLRGGPARVLARRRVVHPQLRPLRADARAGRRTRAGDREGADRGRSAVRVGGVQRERGARGEVRLAVVDQLVVRRLRPSAR